MKPDFERGFISIVKKNKKESKRKPTLLAYYDIKETKEAEICVDCKSKNIKKERQKYAPARKVYAIVNDQFALCYLSRWKYYCYECKQVFYNTETPHPYGPSDKFSQNFVRKALLYWIGDSKLTLTKAASNIGIKTDSIADWNKCLYETFSPIVPKLKGNLVFATFVDKNNIKRGFVCEHSWGSSLQIVAFIEDYSEEWIDKYLKKIQGFSNGMFNELYEVYYDYAPRLGSCLKKYFPAATIGINRNNLYQRICRHLRSFTQKDASSYRDELQKTLFPNESDSYAVAVLPQKLRVLIDQLPADERDEFSGILKQTENDEYLTNSFHMQLAGKEFSTDDWRERIRKMTGQHHPYESIAVKLLYDNNDYKDIIDKVIDKTAISIGKTFDLIVDNPDRFAAMLEVDYWDSDYITEG